MKQQMRQWFFVWLVMRSLLLRHCDPVPTRRNPAPGVPPDPLPPGTPIPDEDLPDPVEPDPPPTEPPPEQPGDELSLSVIDDEWESDEIGVLLVAAEPALEDVETEADELDFEIVPAAAPTAVERTLLETEHETDVISLQIIAAPPPRVPDIVNVVMLEPEHETDVVSSTVTTPPQSPPDPDPPPPPPPPANEWHRTLANQTYFGDIVVPPGESWLIGPGVKIRGSLRTSGGRIGMRPGSSLEFVGANPDAYIGGGMVWESKFANDFGIWISEDGMLDIQGTPKVGWNRTGVIDPAINGWNASDEFWIAPTDVEDFFPRRWFPGQPVPQVHSSMPKAEVVNVTRDIVIKGPGHIHIHAHSRAQRIEYCRLENMGITNAASQGSVLGRYALHFHHGFDATRGSSVKGVAAVNCGKVFVPHLSHGITFNDCVSVNSRDSAFWWDHGDNTVDVIVERMCVLGVQMPDAIGGGQSNVPGLSLPSGLNMTMRNCAVAGVMGGKLAIGFDWPEPTAIFGANPTLVWVFDQGNVAHNNRGPGVRFWTNLGDAHVVENYRSYHNAGGSVENGAYATGNEYDDVISYHDGFYFGNDFSANNAAFSLNSNAVNNTLGRPQQIKNSSFIAHGGPALEIGHRQLPAEVDTEVWDTTLTPAAGYPRVRVLSTTFYPCKVRFLRCGLTPADVVFDDYLNGNEGSHIRIEGANGHGTDINIIGGARVETPF